MNLLNKIEQLVNKSTMHTVDDFGTADWVMALTDEDGFPAASMITASRADGFKWLAFCTGIGAGYNKANRIEKDPRACVYLFDKESFTGVSLRGKIEIITDIETKRQMWYDALSGHFNGIEDEKWCVLMFRPEQYHIFAEGSTIRGMV